MYSIIIFLFFAYLFISMSMTLVGIAHGFLFHRKFQLEALLRHAVMFGFVDGWKMIGGFLGKMFSKDEEDGKPGGPNRGR